MGLNGCATAIKEKTFYGSLGLSGAAVFHMIATDVTNITDAQWQAKWYNISDPNSLMVCETTGDLAEFKKEEEDLCANSQCVEAVNANFQRYFQNFEAYKARYYQNIQKYKSKLK